MQHVIMTDGVTVSDQVRLGVTATEEDSFVEDQAGRIISKLHHPAVTPMSVLLLSMFVRYQ